MRVGTLDQPLLREIELPYLLGYAWLKGTFDRIPGEVVGSAERVGRQKYLRVLEPELGQLLKVNAVHWPRKYNVIPASRYRHALASYTVAFCPPNVLSLSRPRAL